MPHTTSDNVYICVRNKNSNTHHGGDLQCLLLSLLVLLLHLGVSSAAEVSGMLLTLSELRHNGRIPT